MSNDNHSLVNYIKVEAKVQEEVYEAYLEMLQKYQIQHDAGIEAALRFALQEVAKLG